MRLIQIEFRPPVHGNLETLTLFRLPSISPSGTMCFICLTFPDSEVKRGAGKKHIGKPVPTFIQCFQAKVSGQTLSAAPTGTSPRPNENGYTPNSECPLTIGKTSATGIADASISNENLKKRSPS